MASFDASHAYILSGTDPNFTISSLFDDSGVYNGVDADSGDETFEIGDVILVNGPNISGSDYTYIGHFEGGWIGDQFGFKLLFTNTTYNDGDTVTSDPGAFTTCFLAGTHIATPSGERLVEDLVIGDLVLGADGRARPLRWIGRQTVTLPFADARRSFPIRISAGALGESTPSRDLFVSPDHAMLVDGMLVHASALVDGVAIRREAAPAPRFTYFHLEFEDHALVLAEGAAAESFVDHVTRRRFDNYDEYAALYGDAAPSIAELDLPRVKSARQLPDAVRARLDARAAAIGGIAKVA